MNRGNEHPEALLDRLRRGEPIEDPEFVAHLAHCPSCRFESALLLDSAAAAARRPSDELAVARLRRSTARALLARGLRPRRSTARTLLLVAATMLVGSASLAGVFGYRALSRTQGELKDAAGVPSAPASAAQHGVRRAAAGPVEQTPPAPAEVSPEMPAEARAAAKQLGTEPPVAAAARSAAPRATASAAELFSEANRARRAGDVSQAARGYRELTQRFPSSTEAAVARVSFGRLLLDRLGNPRGALAEFDSYLNSAGQRALREEAMIGRAVALGRLGRAGEERSAWAALLREFPRSTYAKHARARLEAPDRPASSP